MPGGGQGAGGWSATALYVATYDEVVEVATPRSTWGTAFWVASTRAGITMPMPVMNMDTPAGQSEVSTESRLISVSPPAAISRPATGRIL